MSSFPNFSNIANFVQTELQNRIGRTGYVSGLNCWVRAASAVTPITQKDSDGNAVAFGSNGLIIYSNPDFQLFKAAGDTNVSAIYGDSSHSGTIGVTWDGNPVEAGTGVSGKPSPIITNFEVDEGSGNISRKANFTIKCFTLEQLNVIAAHYLEPGFTVFLEWGWNTTTGLKRYSANLTPDAVGEYQSFKVVNERRANTSGNSDVFLGFITGGSIKINDAYWDVEIKATGYTELPAYFMAADNVLTNSEVADASQGSVKKSLDFGGLDIWTETDLNAKRFKMAFNELPSTRKTQLVKNLLNDTNVANAVNFINFDDSISDHINSATEGHWYSTAKVSAGDTNVKVADGTKLVGPEKFIRFGALIKIMNTIAVKAYKVGKQDVKYQVFTDNTIISAFDRIFSTDKSKLFIPNPQTPRLEFGDAIKEGGQTDFTKSADNTVSYQNTQIIFPEKNNISKGVANGRNLTYVDTVTNSKIEGLDKNAYKWGFLDNLYVNFDFAKGILDTKNFIIKDALYQILNGMSSAAGSIWDFQIVEVVSPGPNSINPNYPPKDIHMLQVVDMNLVSDTNSSNDIYTFYLQGANSIFIDANFDMDIGGAIMNQVIGNRLSTSNGKGLKQNNALPSYEGKLFSTDYADLVLKKVEEEKAIGSDAQKANDAHNAPAESTNPTDEQTKQQEKDLATFLNKIALYPHVDISDADDAELGDDPYLNNYLAAYNDSQLFESLKLGQAYLDKDSNNQTSILLPIKFTFTMHGVSGIKRGDKFKVYGLPSKYSDSGFFQVLSVKHILDNMTWKTEISGGFRQSKNKK
jgi:hypothetical protein